MVSCHTYVHEMILNFKLLLTCSYVFSDTVIYIFACVFKGNIYKAGKSSNRHFATAGDVINYRKAICFPEMDRVYISYPEHQCLDQ